MTETTETTIPTIDTVREQLVGRTVRGSRQNATITSVNRWMAGDRIRDYIEAEISDSRNGPCRICIVRGGGYRGPSITTENGVVICYEYRQFCNSRTKRADADTLVALLMEGGL